MVKHWLEKHSEEDLEEDRYLAKVIKYTRSSFERQILESVIIQSEKSKSDLLNSRSEYNRCAIPRLTSKLGSKTFEDEERLDIRKEEALEDRIRILRKQRNVERRKA